jgi:hypothetical protein
VDDGCNASDEFWVSQNILVRQFCEVLVFLNFGTFFTPKSKFTRIFAEK